MLLKVEALKAGMLLVYENNSNVGGSIIRDIDAQSRPSVPPSLQSKARSVSVGHRGSE
jgi:hypothetical protein